MPKITITTDGETAITVLSILIQAEIPVEKIEMTQFTNGAADEIAISTKALPSTRKHHKRRDGKRAVDILVERMPQAGNSVTYGKIKRLLTDAGFAEGTVAPMISRLVSRGYLALREGKTPRGYDVLKTIDLNFSNK